MGNFTYTWGTDWFGHLDALLVMLPFVLLLGITLVLWNMNEERDIMQLKLFFTAKVVMFFSALTIFVTQNLLSHILLGGMVLVAYIVVYYIMFLREKSLPINE